MNEVIKILNEQGKEEFVTKDTFHKMHQQNKKIRFIEKVYL